MYTRSPYQKLWKSGTDPLYIVGIRESLHARNFGLQLNLVPRLVGTVLPYLFTAGSFVFSAVIIGMVEILRKLPSSN